MLQHLPIVILTIMRLQKANGFNTAGVALERCSTTLSSDIPQYNVLVPAGSYQLVLTRHPINIEYCIPMCLPIYHKTVCSTG